MQASNQLEKIKDLRRAKWANISFECVQDIKCMHGIDMEAELNAMLQYEMEKALNDKQRQT